MPTRPQKSLQTFPNPGDKPYLIEFDCPEFTCVCPMTEQPDFGTIKISYVPDKLCVELKSLKLYLWSFRNEGHFHEKVVNDICEELQSLLMPRFLKVIGDFYVRGGIKTVVTVTRGEKPVEVEETLHRF